MYFIAITDDTCTSDNSYELSGEMDNVSNNPKRFSPKKDVASTYFDQRIPIPRDIVDHDVSINIINSNFLITFIKLFSC